MEKFTVVIRQEHCINTDFGDCADCAAVKAFKEQYPEYKKKLVLNNPCQMMVNGEDFEGDVYFGLDNYWAVKEGRIPALTINYSKMQSSEQKVQVSDTTKAQSSEGAGKQKQKIRYVKVSKEIEEMEFVEN